MRNLFRLIKKSFFPLLFLFFPVGFTSLFFFEFHCLHENGYNPAENVVEVLNSLQIAVVSPKAPPLSFLEPTRIAPPFPFSSKKKDLYKTSN